MMLNRRQFMQTLGIGLASLVLTRCGMGKEPEDEWDGLRKVWEGLDGLAKDAHDYERGMETRDRLVADHRAAVDRLVSVGGLTASQADDIHIAFGGAANHVWRANAPITCYEPSYEPQYGIISSSDLAAQSELLTEMAGRSDIDPATVTRAQAAIQRDMAFLTMSSEDAAALMDALRAAAEAGQAYPSLAELEFDIPADIVETARILVNALTDSL